MDPVERLAETVQEHDRVLAALGERSNRHGEEIDILRKRSHEAITALVSLTEGSTARTRAELAAIGRIERIEAIISRGAWIMLAAVGTALMQLAMNADRLIAAVKAATQP
jgi:hypothetical protein